MGARSPWIVGVVSGLLLAGCVSSANPPGSSNLVLASEAGPELDPDSMLEQASLHANAGRLPEANALLDETVLLITGPSYARLDRLTQAEWVPWTRSPSPSTS